MPVTALFQSSRYVTHLLRTLPPLISPLIAQKTYPCDLHVLATPPAFVLSQDQTLQFDSSIRQRLSRRTEVVLLILTPPKRDERLNTFIGTHIESVESPPGYGEPYYITLSLLYLALLLTCKRTSCVSLRHQWPSNIVVSLTIETSNSTLYTAHVKHQNRKK